MRLWIFGITEAAEPSAAEINLQKNSAATATVDDFGNKNEAAPTVMASLPKIPRIKTLKNQDDGMETIKAPVDASNKTDQLVKDVPTMRDMPKVAEVPNVVEPTNTEATVIGMKNEYVTNFSREFKHYFADEVTGLERRLHAAQPYVIGSLIVYPVISTYRKIHRDGLLHYIHKTPHQGKIIQLLMLTTGIAAAAYQYNSPPKNKFLQEFKDA